MMRVWYSAFILSSQMSRNSPLIFLYALPSFRARRDTIFHFWNNELNARAIHCYILQTTQDANEKVLPITVAFKEQVTEKKDAVLVGKMKIIYEEFKKSSTYPRRLAYFTKTCTNVFNPKNTEEVFLKASPANPLKAYSNCLHCTGSTYIFCCCLSIPFTTYSNSLFVSYCTTRWGLQSGGLCCYK